MLPMDFLLAMFPARPLFFASCCRNACYERVLESRSALRCPGGSCTISWFCWNRGYMERRLCVFRLSDWGGICASLEQSADIMALYSCSVARQWCRNFLADCKSALFSSRMWKDAFWRFQSTPRSGRSGL